MAFACEDGLCNVIIEPCLQYWWLLLILKSQRSYFSISCGLYRVLRQSLRFWFLRTWCKTGTEVGHSDQCHHGRRPRNRGECYCNRGGCHWTDQARQNFLSGPSRVRRVTGKFGNSLIIWLFLVELEILRRAKLLLEQGSRSRSVCRNNSNISQHCWAKSKVNMRLFLPLLQRIFPGRNLQLSNYIKSFRWRSFRTSKGHLVLDEGLDKEQGKDMQYTRCP